MTTAYSMSDPLFLPGVEPIEIRREPGVVTIVVVEATDDPPRKCPTCNGRLYRHGSRPSIFADTPYEMEPARLEVYRHRYHCESCGKTIMADLEFLDERHRATKRLIHGIRKQCLKKTFHALAQETGLAVNTIKNISLELVEDLQKSIRFETPIYMGMDELRFGGELRTIITNLENKNVLQILADRAPASLKSFFKTLHDREKVEWVCTDMYRPFILAFSPYLPNARSVIDKFHVVRMATKAMDDERYKYKDKFPYDKQNNFNKQIRWLTRKKTASFTERDEYNFKLFEKNFPNLALAYYLKEIFYDIYACDDKESAIKAFLSWKDLIPKYGYEKFHNLTKTVENYFDGIFAYWDCPLHITNAFTECSNGIVKLANRLGRGYSFEILRSKILYEKVARTNGWPSAIPNNKANRDPTNRTLEYGPHIPTLVERAEAGELV